MLTYILLAFGGLIIAGLVPLVVLRARALDRRIEEHLAEEERGPKDPYAQMAEIARVQEAISEGERRSWPKG